MINLYEKNIIKQHLFKINFENLYKPQLWIQTIQSVQSALKLHYDVLENQLNLNTKCSKQRLSQH